MPDDNVVALLAPQSSWFAGSGFMFANFTWQLGFMDIRFGLAGLLQMKKGDSLMQIVIISYIV